MITYEYCQLALGRSLTLNFNFFDKSKQFVIDKNKIDESKVHVTTDSHYTEDIPNLIYHRFNQEFPLYSKKFDGTIRTRSSFNYNLKFLAIKNALKTFNSDYLIMTDGDFSIESGYSVEKIQDFLSSLKEEDSDIFSYLKGVAKYEDGSITKECAWGYKVDFYKVYELDPPVYIFQEQFLVFKNGTKLNEFIRYWEELCKLSIDNNIDNYAECLEIGIAAKKANMKVSNGGACAYKQLKGCYSMPIWQSEHHPEGKIYMW